VLGPLRERRRRREVACATRDSGGRPGEEDDWAGAAHQRGRRGKGRVGRPKATRPAGQWADMWERGGGPRLGRLAAGSIGPKVKEKFFSE
jgi:hypothetical protein